MRWHQKAGKKMRKIVGLIVSCIALQISPALGGNLNENSIVLEDNVALYRSGNNYLKAVAENRMLGISAGIVWAEKELKEQGKPGIFCKVADPSIVPVLENADRFYSSEAQAIGENPSIGKWTLMDAVLVVMKMGTICPR